jgi:alpha-ketoglutarate-dependent taurine dioxygenase
VEVETVPLTLPPSADPSKFSNFGRQVIGVDPGNLSPSDFAEIQQLLYKVITVFDIDTTGHAL